MQGARESSEQGGLAEAGHALEQNMAGSQQADEHAIDYVLLSDDDLGDLLPDLIEPGNRGLDIGI